MVKIIADTSTMFTVSQGKELGIDILPLHVVVDKVSYEELEQLTTNQLIEMIENGHIPSSSQPSMGSVIETFEKYPNEEVLGIFMADGLSGTYASASSASQMIEGDYNITVINSETLCGPHRYLVLKAKELADQGKNVQEITEELKHSIKNGKSFLLPQDFSYLKRGGRLTPLAATLGGLLKIVPVMTMTEDRKRLEKFAVGRTFNMAVGKVLAELEKDLSSGEYKVFVSHGGTLAQGEAVVAKIKEKFKNVDVEMFELTPAFITQGGPKCIAIQWIEK